MDGSVLLNIKKKYNNKIIFKKKNKKIRVVRMAAEENEVDAAAGG
jgi:hypothetical protein